MYIKELACQQVCGISLLSLVEPYLILPYYAIVKGDTKPGYSYSSFNAARSAISTVVQIDGTPAGQHKIVCLFMRSAAKQRSKLPRDGFIWKPDLLLKTFDGWGSNTKLFLSTLTKKVQASNH
ncbi:hypothetical protein E2C01_030248 [Portunus trituberculatus]|uniref:Uncharacterized protein n=1 Tax=Portunus trituberculatus TaxID=210409 RepID=A0A5B7EUU8_PORTR|nr:hypothetical protein [Portunus trituberculatus]